MRICPINLDIFANAEFVSSELTDRPIPAAERLKTTSPQTVQNITPFLTVPEVLALVTADADPPLDVEAPATSSSDGSEHPSDLARMLQSPSCSNRISNVNYILSSAILPVPKAPAQKTTCSRKHRKTTISSTDTPEKYIIQQRHTERQQKANGKSLRKKN